MNYLTCVAKNGWRSVDAHSQNGAVTVWQLFLPRKAAHILVMHYSDQITIQLTYLQNLKSLTLQWHSFQWPVHSTSAAINNSFHEALNLLAVFLTDSDWALWPSRAQKHSCTLRSHTTKSYLSFQKRHCASYASVYQPILTSYCSPFSHIISLTKTLGQDT